MKFNVFCPEILFGEGTAATAAKRFQDSGRRTFLVTGQSRERSAWLEELLGDPATEGRIYRVTGEPTLDAAMDAVSAARSTDCGQVIGLGGGSVLDTAKVVAVMLTNRGEILEYLEVIGGGRSLAEPPVPCLTLPTTAGTGAEVTMNAVLADPEHRVKVSMRGPHLLPTLAAVDPSLARWLPPDVTAATGMDALVQLIEAFLSPMATPFTDALCREALPRAARALPIACGESENPAAREDMALAACFSGLALAHAKLGAVHGLAGAIGGMTHAPHGLICARLLPHVLKANRRAMENRDPENQGLRRLAELATLGVGKQYGGVDSPETWALELVESLPLGNLRDFGLQANDFESIARQAQMSSSMKGNPILLTVEELTGVLREAQVGARCHVPN